MKTSYAQTVVQNGIVWTLVVTVLALLAAPRLAAAQTGALDVARMDAFVRQQVQRHGIPGLALGIVEGDEIVHLAGYGLADAGGQAVTAQTPFLLASVSKPLTSLAVMQLVEAGEVELDAPVQRYVPEFRMADAAASQQITVRHLLQHTSGMPVTACDTRIGAETLAAYVAELERVALSAPVGTRHNYCSGNYNVLGRVIEQVSGQSFGAYMQEHVFAPLEMRQSFSSEEAALQAGMAQGFQWLFGVRVSTHHRYNPSQLPSGYLISSAEDMSHFLIAQLNGGQFGDSSVLSPAGIAAMQSEGVEIGPGRGEYALGWRIGEVGGVPAIFHYGDNFNYHTLILMLPESGRGVVMLMNANSVVGFFTAFQEIEEGVTRLLAGEKPAAPQTLRFGTLYLLIDLVWTVALGLALWPLLRLGRWFRAQQRKMGEGGLRPWHVGLRLVWEFGLPLILLAGTRLALHGMGAQSWLEGLGLLTDVILWIWTIALVMLVTGAARFVLFRQLLRGSMTKGRS